VFDTERKKIQAPPIEEREKGEGNCKWAGAMTFWTA